MITLSICMIVKNEADVLSRCLECVKDIADEIIIIDTGSQDDTKIIAKKYTSLIYDYPWHDDFSAARNYSFSKAKMEYCMWLDADDVIDESNLEKIKTLKHTLTSEVDMIYFKYAVAFDNENNPTMTYYRERIFKTAAHPQWRGEIHEVIPPFGKYMYTDITIFHKKMKSNPPQRNLKIYQKMLQDGKQLDARQTYYYARELYYNKYYEEAISVFTEFLNKEDGWIENNISACKDLASCYYLTNQKDSALQVLLRSFTYDAPRAEICCELGRHFMEQAEYLIAIFWYETAANREKNEQNGGFCLLDCYNYIPYMQLCVCYDRLGDKKKAEYYNEKAGTIKPYDEGYLYNKRYFLKARQSNKGPDKS